jgi:hypothetical protein
MLRKLILSAAIAGALGVASMPADARPFVAVGIGLPVPVVVGPPVVYGPGYYYGPHYYGPRYWGPTVAFGPRWHGGPGPGWHHGWR